MTRRSRVPNRSPTTWAGDSAIDWPTHDERSELGIHTIDERMVQAHDWMTPGI